MSRRDAMDEGRINAWLDGELSPEARAELDRAAQSDPRLAARLATDRALRDALREAFDPVLHEPVPARLLRAALPRPWSWWRRGVAAAACVILGAALGWQVAHLPGTAPGAGSRPVSIEAAAAHAVYLPEVRHPVEVDASQRTHLDAWLSKRLAHPMVSPDLGAFGLRLVGGRLLPDAGRPAAQYMYESADGERITVYARVEARAAAPTALRFDEDRGFQVIHWHDEDGMAYAVTGRLDRARMEQVARAVHEQM